MTSRKKAPDDVVTEVLTRSRRRCCVCYGLHRNGDIKPVALRNVILPASPMFPEGEEEEALSFHTGTHRSQSAVLVVADGPKTLEEINAAIPPSDLDALYT